MLILDILHIPIEFIREHLTGWILLIIVVFIIYFICLRKYYIQREKFYDVGAQLKNLEDIESAEDDIDSSINTTSEEEHKKDMRNARKEYKQERKVLKISNRVDVQFNQDDENTTSRHNTRRSKQDKQGKQDKQDKQGKQDKQCKQDKQETKAKVLEGFDSDISITPSIAATSNSNSSGNNSASANMPPIATTLFDNLNLNDTQIQACKANYNQVIAQLISDLGKLSVMYSRNRYLNLKKQFDSILAKGVDNIMNYITLTIKSPRILTRTAIRTEVISTINNTIENLIDKTNKDLTAAMNTLAMMNSTSIDYNSQLRGINDSRASLEKYIAIDKLVNELGHNINVSQRQISSILDKSYILPIYERNFDKISQLAKSDFNDNEGNLAMKYSKAYGDFLEQEKKEELNINPLSLASQIESGIVNMLSHIGDSNSAKSTSKSNEIKTIANITGEYGDDWYVSNGELKEQMTRAHNMRPTITSQHSQGLTRDYGFTNDYSYSKNGISQVANNPIPKQELSGGLLGGLNKENIFSDPSNRGSYMINSKAQGDILEGFADSNINNTRTTPTTTTSPATTTRPATTRPANTKSQTINPSSTSPSLIKAFDDSNLTKKSKKQDSGTDITSKLFSGDFLQYMLDTINGYMTGGYDVYKNQINNYLGGVYSPGGFKLEDNMIPAGFALFILSMLLYFVDVSS